MWVGIYIFWAVVTQKHQYYFRNFVQFLPIFGEKMAGFFSENQSYDQVFEKKTSSSLNKNAIFSPESWGKYFKNHNIGPPWSPCLDTTLASNQDVN
jgi:hypothetical protein